MSAPKPLNEEARLDALRRYRILDTAPEPAFDDYVQIAAQICEVPIAAISLIDEDRQWFKARVGVDATQTPRTDAFCAHTILGTQPFVVEDAVSDPRFVNNPLVTGEPRIRFYTGAPLIDSDGAALGSICVIDREPRRLNTGQTAALEALSRRVISALEYRRAAFDLASALEEVRILQGLLPICSHCKNVRDDTGYWRTVDHYLAKHSNLDLSHSVCPECLPIHYPDVYARMVARKQDSGGAKPA